jgi:hypothetical protein
LNKKYKLCQNAKCYAALGLEKIVLKYPEDFFAYIYLPKDVIRRMSGLLRDGKVYESPVYSFTPRAQVQSVDVALLCGGDVGQPGLAHA